MSQEWVFVLVGLAAFVGTIAWARVLGRLTERGSRRREQSSDPDATGTAPDSGGRGSTGPSRPAATAKAPRSGGSTGRQQKPRKSGKRRKRHHR